VLPILWRNLKAIPADDYVRLRKIPNLTLKAITPTDHGLDVLRILGIISQGNANLSNPVVYSLLGIEENVICPQPVLNLFPSEELAGALQQKDKNFEGLFFKLYRSPTAPKLVSRKIEFAFLKNDEFRQPRGPYLLLQSIHRPGRGWPQSTRFQ
jgi:hypothetical protein